VTSIQGTKIFDRLPPQAPLKTPEGQAYGQRVLERSRTVLLSQPSLLDRSYGADYYQKVDVFLPASRVISQMPILVFAHGGSWIAGYKEWMAFMAPAVTALPAVFVSVSYRLAPANTLADLVDDCAAAIAWVYAHAVEFRADRSRLFVGGHSAGGHLMSLTALRPDLFTALGLPRDVVKGCLAVSTPFDLRLPDPAWSSNLALLQAVTAGPVDMAAVSPLAHITRDAPPFLIAIGENDFPVIRHHGVRMRDGLAQANVPTTFLDLVGHDHFATGERIVEPGHPWLREAAQILH
jgi:arylformamidase